MCKPGFLVLCGLILAFGSTAHALRYQSASNDACEACQFSVHMLEDLLCDPAATQYLIGLVERDICAELPVAAGEWKVKCKNLAEGLLPVLVQWLRASSTPLQLCKAAGACSASAGIRAESAVALQAASRVQDAGQCSICKFLIGRVQLVLNDTTTVAQLNETAQHVCSSLPAEIAPVCTSLWDTYEPLIVSFVEHADSGQLCALLGMCLNDLLERTASVPLPAVPAAAALHALSKARLVAQSQAVGFPLGDACDSCKMAVIEAHSLITSPSIQANLVNYTKALCDSFPSFADACKTYVDMYSPLVFNLLQQYLVPDQVCVEIGMCKPPQVTLVAQLLARAQAALGLHAQGQQMAAKYGSSVLREWFQAQQQEAQAQDLHA